MNAALLLEHYAQIADASDAIARLRRFILDLAVRGKLVEQDPNDEPASELLKRIEAESIERSVRGLDKALRIKREDLPFSPPPQWEWAKLISFSEASYGFAFASSRFNGDKIGMPLIRIRDISSTDTEAYFDGEYDPWYVVKPGDYLVGMDGDFNLRRWQGREALLNQRVLRLRGWRFGIEPEFVRLPLQMILNHLHGGTSQTTVKHLSAKQVNGIEIPLPPLAEQHRIVAKVDELMALCDQLEAARAEREAGRDKFTLSALAKLNEPDPETFADDASFALEHLEPLTKRTDQIKQLRQTILNLAVRGKLVAQDPNDEPASELLKRIAAEKAHLIKQRVIKKSDVPTISSEEEPYSVNGNWAWARLGDIGDWGAGSTPPRGNTDLYGGGITWLKSGELNDNRELAGSEETVTDHAVKTGSFRLNEPGDVLIAMYGATIGKLAILAEKAVTNQAVCGCTPFSGVSNQYLFLFLMSQREQFHSASEGGAQPNISKVKIVNTAFPLPPLAEQHRIVAKVDELMTLCDMLEASLSEGEQTRSKLLEAVLHGALGNA